ncbi:MAG TPA: PEGA domain-containing protein, partial [Terriglobales bacterium]|nr:PEGA domain-containing protein [Terriglobales bacterium]
MKSAVRRFLPLAVILVAGINLAMAKDIKKNSKAETGQVYVTVLPEEAYIWVDGKPMSHRNSLLTLSSGEHKIMVVNYGYEPATANVTVGKSDYQEVHAKLKPAGGPVPGPLGRIQIEGVTGNALVMMNGTTPEFFVGHADEFNNNFMNKQQLLLPVGKHQLYILRNKTGETIWSGPVEVKADKRLIVYANRGKEGQLVYKDWPEGKKLKPEKRFNASTATATVAVAPITGKFGADKQQVGCNQPVQLAWSSENAGKTTVTANGETLADSATGQLSVTPKDTTKYEFRAAGPGGIVSSESTVQVDKSVHVSLASSTPEIRYVKVGDRVQEEGTADLVWKVQNADSAQIETIGAVSGESGRQTVKAAPKQTSEGPINETQVYR